MRLVVLRRRKELKGGRALISAMSVLVGMLLFSVVLWAFGKSPVETFSTIIMSFVSPALVMDFLILTMLGYALAISFKASIWNIGAEGQFFIAMIPVAYILLVFFPQPESSPLPYIALSIAAAGAMGGLWGLIAGAIKAYTGLDEVPVTLILNYIAYYIVDYLVHGPLRGKHVFGYVRTDDINSSYRINVMWQQPLQQFPPGPLGALEEWAYGMAYQLMYYAYWLAAAVAFALLAWLLYSRTIVGLKLKIVGTNPDFLIVTGSSVRRQYMTALTISGAMAGIAGALFMLGYWYRIPYPIEAQTAGYGYLAILVAWLAMIELPFIPVTAYVVSALRNAGISLQIAGLGGLEQTLLVIGMVLLAYSLLRFLVEYEVRIVR